MALRKSLTLLLMVIVGLGWSGVARAQEPNIDDQVNRIGRGLYCPVCPNIPLDQCNTPACVQWRAQIKELLEKGQSEEVIRQYFVEQYGARVLGEPPAEGLNWLVYVLPPLALTMGALVVWLTLRKRLTLGDRESPDAMRIPHKYVERIEREVQADTEP